MGIALLNTNKCYIHVHVTAKLWFTCLSVADDITKSATINDSVLSCHLVNCCTAV